MPRTPNRSKVKSGSIKNFAMSTNATALVDFLVNIRYLGATTRTEVINEILRHVYLNPNILNDGLLYSNLEERFLEYINTKEWN